jgi:hypothetical protein
MIFLRQLEKKNKQLQSKRSEEDNGSESMKRPERSLTQVLYYQD